MDRNREQRRATHAMTTANNGISRRRQRSNSLRDSPDEDLSAEMHEVGRLRDRTVKKDRDRTVRNKKRRIEDESSEGSVDDDADDDEEEGTLRMLPPNPSVTGHGHSQQQLQQQHVSGHVIRSSKVFVSSNTNKTFKPVQGWKPTDEMIGFSVPRKARSVSKRSHENWVSGAGTTPEHILRQVSPSPSPSTAPLSPSSSNVSVRKKMKTNGSKQKPPKSSSMVSSSNPEELEIEIAEVLYGLRAQSEAPQKKETDFSMKFDPIRPSNESISRVSSPISNSAPTAPQNSSSSTVPFSAVAPKRKKPRQVSGNISSISARNSQISSTAVKSEIDQQPNIETLLPNSAKNTTTGSENGNFQSLSLDFALSETPAKEPPAPVRSPVRGSPLPVRSPVEESPAIKPEDSHCDVAMTKVNFTTSEIYIQREEKFEIDLMAPPPQLRSSSERGNDIDFAAVAEPKPVVSVAADAELRKMMLNQEKDVKASKSGRDEITVEEPEFKKAKSAPVSSETEKALMIKEKNIDLQLDLEKPDKDNTDSLLLSGNKSHPHVEKQQQPQLKVAKDEQPRVDKTAQSSSLPLAMALASWPGGAPPMGYMSPLQGVVSMDGSQVPPTPVQPLFTQPRPKRCATHCYIARNIHYLQQFMKMNPFWPTPAAAGPTSLLGGKPSNLSVVPPMELHGRGITSVQDKGQQGLAIFPGKEKASQPSSTMVDAHRKQQQPILLQQALHPGATPSNMMHGPAFIFPFNQHQTAAAVAAASVRPGPTKFPTTAPVSAATSASVNGSSAAAPTPAAMSFNYPNMPSNETQYLAILQNNAYPFPIPAPAYRGTHPQPMPFFNGSFYTSQMIHPSQLQQQPSPQPHQQLHQQIQPGQPNTSISSGSSSSQKQHIQNQQQRPPQGNANLNTFPPLPKTRPAQSSQPHQARNIENETGHEDSPSTADSRSSRGQMSAYNQNFSMPIHHQNFALVSSTQALAGTSNGNNNAQGENKKQQQSQPQGLKPGGETTFAMSFTPMNGGSNTTPGGSIDLSSVAQSHAVFQNLSEADRRNYQVMQAAAVAQAAQQRKNFRVAEEGKNGVNSLNINEEKKGLPSKSSVTSGQSIAFTRSELTDPLAAPLTGTNVIDSSASARNLNSNNMINNRGSRNSITNNSQLGQLQNMQFQQQHIQQQMVHIQKQQQQLQQQFTASRNSKSQPTSNGGVYGDHLSTSSPSSGSKFPNTISVFPQSNSPSQSPQWKNSTRAQAQSSSTSSMKNVPQQQQPRPQQSHTQISFGSGQKQQAGPCSPTTSLSKGGGGSPRAPSSNSQGSKASLLSSQQSKNASSVASLKTPSILGNPHNIASSNSNTKSQQQQQQQMKQMANQPPQLFFSPTFMQTQPPQSTSNPSNTTSGYYLQRRYPEKQPQLQGGSPSGTSTGMLSLCTPVTQASSSTVEAKAGSASNSTKGPPGILHHHPQFQLQSSGSYTYAHSVPAGVQIKPTTEQKQPAGSREPSTRK